MLTARTGDLFTRSPHFLESQGKNRCAKLGAAVNFFGARTNVTLREGPSHRESRRICRIIIAEVLFGAVKARLSVLCAYNSFNNSGRKETLGRLGSGRSEQRNYLFHRPENITVGFHSGESVLSRALRSEPESMAQGRNCNQECYLSDSSTSESQSGRFNTSRGLGPSAAPTIPSLSIRSIRCAARP